MKNSKIIGTICIIVTTLAYGLIPGVSFLAFDAGLETGTILFDKFFYAAILMWGFILIKKINFKLTLQQWKPMIAVMLSYIGVATFLYLAFNYISGSLATIISFTYPAMVLVFQMITGNERANALKITAVILSLIGLCFVVWSPGMKVNFLGVFFALLCAVSYVVYAVSLSSPKLDGMHPLVTPAYLLAASTIFNFFRCIISGDALFHSGIVQFGYIALLAVVCAFLAILCFCTGVRLIGPTNAAIINTSEPVCACVFSYILVGDEFTGSMIIGGIFIVAAVLLTSLPERNKKTPLADK